MCQSQENKKTNKTKLFVLKTEIWDGLYGLIEILMRLCVEFASEGVGQLYESNIVL